MSGRPVVASSLRSLVLWVTGFRYIKFGLVGASGTVVNMAVLFVAHEHLFQSVETHGRPYASLALAITLATINNFTWNRLWTWADRVEGRMVAQAGEMPLHVRPTHRTLLGQFARYAIASWFGIALQYGLTLWLAHALHYMVANVIAIVIASVSNFLANDRWTFKARASSAP